MFSYVKTIIILNCECMFTCLLTPLTCELLMAENVSHTLLYHQNLALGLHILCLNIYLTHFPLKEKSAVRC